MMSHLLENLDIEIFADGANLTDMIKKYNEMPLIKGFTTNPTLLRKAGVEDYAKFAKQVVELIPDRSLSFEVIADELDVMMAQAKEISSWGENVFVKIPVMNTQGMPTYRIIDALSSQEVKVNVTAVFTLGQVDQIERCLRPGVPAYISIFAGRIADSGVDPTDLMTYAPNLVAGTKIKIIWASPREILNIFQAEQCCCNIIPVADSLLNKLHLVGKNHRLFSQETVQMFYDDAKKAGYKI